MLTIMDQCIANLESGIRAALPKYLAPERVTAVRSGERQARVQLDGRLVWSLGLGGRGWNYVEMGLGAGPTREVSAVQRGISRAMKASRNA